MPKDLIALLAKIQAAALAKNTTLLSSYAEEVYSSLGYNLPKPSTLRGQPGLFELAHFLSQQIKKETPASAVKLAKIVITEKSSLHDESAALLMEIARASFKDSNHALALEAANTVIGHDPERREEAARFLNRLAQATDTLEVKIGAGSAVLGFSNVKTTRQTAIRQLKKLGEENPDAVIEGLRAFYPDRANRHPDDVKDAVEIGLSIAQQLEDSSLAAKAVSWNLSRAKDEPLSTLTHMALGLAQDYQAAPDGDPKHEWQMMNMVEGAITYGPTAFRPALFVVLGKFAQPLKRKPAGERLRLTDLNATRHQSVMENGEAILRHDRDNLPLQKAAIGFLFDNLGGSQNAGRVLGLLVTHNNATKPAYLWASEKMIALTKDGNFEKVAVSYDTIIQAARNVLKKKRGSEIAKEAFNCLAKMGEHLRISAPDLARRAAMAGLQFARASGEKAPLEAIIRQLDSDTQTRQTHLKEIIGAHRSRKAAPGK